jgi:hypothetical protein
MVFVTETLFRVEDDFLWSTGTYGYKVALKNQMQIKCWYFITNIIENSAWQASVCGVDINLRHQVKPLKPLALVLSAS